jgi:hypothetical protein
LEEMKKSILQKAFSGGLNYDSFDWSDFLWLGCLSWSFVVSFNQENQKNHRSDNDRGDLIFFD